MSELLYQIRKLAEAVDEINRYNFAILGVTVAKWTGTRKQKLNSEEVLMWSGNQDNNQQAVALVINRKHANTLPALCKDELKYTKVSVTVSPKTPMNRRENISTALCNKLWMASPDTKVFRG